jgi:hypothetical protein
MVPSIMIGRKNVFRPDLVLIQKEGVSLRRSSPVGVSGRIQHCIFLARKLYSWHEPIPSLEKFSSKSDAKKHAESVHVDKSTREYYPCQQENCAKVFDSPSGARRHAKRQHGEVEADDGSGATPLTSPIAIVCISDTSVPDGDILIHARDLTQSGSFKELQTALTWLPALTWLRA